MQLRLAMRRPIRSLPIFGLLLAASTSYARQLRQPRDLDSLTEATKSALESGLGSQYGSTKGYFHWQREHIANPDGYYGWHFFPDIAWGVSLFAWCKNSRMLGHDVCRGNYALGKNDAIITVLTSPPEVDYFGFQTYVVARNMSFVPAASVADAINMLNIKVDHRARTQFGQPFVLITTADRSTLKVLRKTLRNYGVHDELINVDVIDMKNSIQAFERGHVNASEPTWDALRTLGRVSGASNDHQLQAYLRQKFMSWWVTAPYDGRFEPIPFPGRKQRGTNNESTEVSLTTAFESLRDAVMDSLRNEAEGTNIVGDIPLYFVVPEEEKCLQNSSYMPVFPPRPQLNFSGRPGCDFFSNDALYSLVDPAHDASMYEFRENRGFVWVGVNSFATGKATFLNLLVSEVREGSSTNNTFEQEGHNPNVGHEEITGSAKAWAQGRVSDEDAGKLFAWRFARTCPRGYPYSAFCTEVSTDMIQTPPGVWAGFVSRSYLERETTVGAAPEESLVSHTIVYDRDVELLTTM